MNKMLKLVEANTAARKLRELLLEIGMKECAADVLDIGFVLQEELAAMSKNVTGVVLS